MHAYMIGQLLTLAPAISSGITHARQVHILPVLNGIMGFGTARWRTCQDRMRDDETYQSQDTLTSQIIGTIQTRYPVRDNILNPTNQVMSEDPVLVWTLLE